MSISRLYVVDSKSKQSHVVEVVFFSRRHSTRTWQQCSGGGGSPVGAQWGIPPPPPLIWSKINNKCLTYVSPKFATGLYIIMKNEFAFSFLTRLDYKHKD